MPTHELIVRLNGVHPAFSQSGRLRSRQPRVSTSVSVFVFTDGRRALHTLLDCGPGVGEAVTADDVFPEAFPLDWLLLSHAHADHFLGIELLSGDLRHWARVQEGRPGRLRVHCLPQTYTDTLKTHFDYLDQHVDHSPGQPGVPFTLWQDGAASLEVTFLEVLHFRQSAASVFHFRDGCGGEARVVCLFDFGDFHPPGSPQYEAGGRPDHPLLQRPDLLVAESTNWADPRTTRGKWNGHVCFEKLAEYLCQWRPVQTRVVHYAGDDDAYGPARQAVYRGMMAEGRRIHPRFGPTSPWELTAAMQQHLHGLGHPDPRSVVAGRAGETMLLWPPPERG